MEYKSINDFTNDSDMKRKNYFFNLCRNENNFLEIKKLQIQAKTKMFFNSELVTAGLIASIYNSQEKIYNNLFDFAEKHKIEFKNYEINALFNSSTNADNSVLIQYLDKKYSILETTLKNDGYIDMDSTGKVSSRFVWFDENSIITKYDEQVRGFYCNPFKFSVINFNTKMTDNILNNYQINPTLIEELFVEQCAKNKTKICHYLLSNNIAREVIKNSEAVNLFLNEPEEYQDEKKDIKIALSMFDLSQELKLNKDNNKKIKL